MILIQDECDYQVQGSALRLTFYSYWEIEREWKSYREKKVHWCCGLWEITLRTAYLLGLKRIYRLTLRIQHRIVSPKYPKLLIYSLVYSYLNSLFDSQCCSYPLLVIIILSWFCWLNSRYICLCILAILSLSFEFWV